MKKLFTGIGGLLGISGTSPVMASVQATDLIPSGDVVSIADLLLKIVVACVTLWQLVKPKKTV